MNLIILNKQEFIKWNIYSSYYRKCCPAHLTSPSITSNSKLLGSEREQGSWSKT